MTKIARIQTEGQARSLTDCTLVVHRGSLYEPFHRRLSFVEEDGKTAYGLALDADNNRILQVETPVNGDTPRARRMAEFEARRALATALHEHFRSAADTGIGRAPTLTTSQRPIPELGEVTA